MSFSGKERRESPRIRVHVPAVIVVESNEDTCETVEIGRGGIFIATFESYLLLQLIEIRLELEEGRWLEIGGMVVRIVGEEAAFRLDTEPGVGIQFYGADEETESRWNFFFHDSLQAAGFYQDADTLQLRKELSTITAPPPLDLPETIECIEDAQVMLARGYTIEQVSRAAGLDPSIVAAAFAGAEENHNPSDVSPLGQTVEGISLLSSKPEPLSFEEENATSPSTVRLKPALTQNSALIPQGPSTSIIKLIGSSPPQEGKKTATEEPGLEDSETIPTGEAALKNPQGPIQPPSRESTEKRSPRLVSSTSVPLAPSSLLPHVVYRLEMPTLASLVEFQHAALEPGGVFILTTDLRPSGTPVVVCVVHSDSHDEFHIPGTVTHSLGSNRGVNIKFTGVTVETLKSFDSFVSRAKPPGQEKEQSYPSQEITMSSKSSELFTTASSDSSIPRDTLRIKVSEIKPME